MKNLHFSLSLILIVCFAQGFSQQRPFPYSLSKQDWIIAPLSLTALLASEYLDKNNFNLTEQEISELDRNNINSFDRMATHNWSESAERSSDITERIVRYSPLLYAVPVIKNKQWKDGATLVVMYAEVMMLNSGVTGITKSLAQRIRPYLYNTSLTVEERFAMQGEEAPMASTSFFSGHSSTAFASAVFFSKTFTDIYGRGAWSTVVWAGSLSLATATAIARVEAGVHFPTDVLVGAIVGSAIGYTIPMLHKTKTEKLSFSVFPTGLYCAYKL
jgi:membrane-associated phospholipid phosphatase